jgi:putative spermidine/putrescine transport system permease protein
MAATETIDQPLVTADGTPLKVSLQRSLRRNKLRAAILVLPPFLFLLFIFIIPIGDLLLRSVDDKLINETLPRTFVEFEEWDGTELPGEPMYEAMYLDITEAPKLSLGRASTRMNYELSGWRSLIKKSGRKFKNLQGRHDGGRQALGRRRVLAGLGGHEGCLHPRLLLERHRPAL